MTESVLPNLHGMSREKAEKPRLTPLRYRIEEAADAIAVSPRFLRYRIDEGELPIVRDGGGVFVKAKDLSRYASINHPFSPKKLPKIRPIDREAKDQKTEDQNPQDRELEK
jgi:excisionase family DNA binding protein